MKINTQRGFTLVEIAIVLVIIGLLLGGILKGQELINSARVRNLADMNSGIQAAYYGFIDRYRQVPGDWAQAAAQTAIGVTISTGGDGSGAIDPTSGGGNMDEAAAVWEQLSKAGFIQGSYDATGVTDVASYVAAGSAAAPVNAFNGLLFLARNADYTGTASTRLNLHLGRNIPVNIARELDVKLDDSKPQTGVLREAGTAGTFGVLGTSNNANCQAGGEYDIAGDEQSCNLAFLY